MNVTIHLPTWLLWAGGVVYAERCAERLVRLYRAAIEAHRAAPPRAVEAVTPDAPTERERCASCGSVADLSKAGRWLCEGCYETETYGHRTVP